MIKKIGANPYGVVEFTASTEIEIADLPKNVGQGSYCLVLENSEVYMFDEESSTWKKL